jgi:adenosylmethionine-8-amino-7-oxononanoate aminotransferase
MGQKLKQGCKEMKEKSRHIGDIRGEGLMLGIELVKNKTRKTPIEPRHVSMVCSFLKDNGLIVYPNPCGISMFPAFIITESQVDHILDILARVLVNLRLEV